MLKKQLRILRDVRDLQVSRELLIALAPQTSSRKEVLRDIQQKRSVVADSALSQLRSFNEGRFSKKLSRFRSHIIAHERDDTSRRRIAHAIDEHYAVVLQDVKNIDPSDVECFHRLRIVFKLLRYTIEVVYPLFPHLHASQGTSMDEYQQRLGQIQDTCVLIDYVSGIAETTPSVDVHAIQAICMQHRNELIASFMKISARVSSFWQTSTIYDLGARP